MFEGGRKRGNIRRRRDRFPTGTEWRWFYGGVNRGAKGRNSLYLYFLHFIFNGHNSGRRRLSHGMCFLLPPANDKKRSRKKKEASKIVREKWDRRPFLESGDKSCDRTSRFSPLPRSGTVDPGGDAAAAIVLSPHRWLLSPRWMHAPASP
jgi:hypothetical protein